MNKTRESIMRAMHSKFWEGHWIKTKIPEEGQWVNDWNHKFKKNTSSV